MLTAFFIFNRKGDVLIARIFRDLIRHNIAEVFRIQVISSSEVRLPVLTLGLTTFLHTYTKGLWFVAVTRSNQDAAVIFEFLHKFRNLLEGILCREADGPHELIDEAVTSQFPLVYEILDRCIEFGYPQNLDAIASLYSQGHTSQSLINKVAATAGMIKSPNPRDDYSVSWRRQGIKYRKNEVLLTVNEDVHVLMTANGSVLKSYVDGVVNMKTKLLGMPHCRLGLNDSLAMGDTAGDVDYDLKNSDAIPKAAAGSVVLEDCKFHQCVELEKFDSERLIHFVPPDGEFELMRYRALENVNLPFLVVPNIPETSRSPVTFSISLKSLFPPKLAATNVVVKIPVPPGSIKAHLEAASGKARFSSEECAVLWKFNKVSGQHETILQGTIDVVPPTSPTEGALSPKLGYNKQSKLNWMGWSRPPITVQFTLEMFSASGLVVRYLKVVEKGNYNTMKFIKYCLRAGTYEIRY